MVSLGSLLCPTHRRAVPLLSGNRISGGCDLTSCDPAGDLQLPSILTDMTDSGLISHLCFPS